MPLLLKGPSGNLTVTAGGAATGFTNYGVPPEAASFNATAGLVNVLVDPDDPDSTSVASAMQGGTDLTYRAIARTDGHITLDLTGITDLTDVTVTYTKTKNSTPTETTATVTLAAKKFNDGYSRLDFYLPPFDPVTRRLRLYPDEDTRIILCAGDAGLSGNDIVNAEPGLASAPGDWGNWILNNNVNGQSYQYGQHDNHALDYELATIVCKKLRTEFSSPWLLVRRGSTVTGGHYDPSVGNAQRTTYESLGKSALHPILHGAYGEGAEPYYIGFGPRCLKAANVVFEDYKFDK